LESLYQASLQASQDGCFGWRQQDVAWHPLSHTGKNAIKVEESGEHIKGESRKTTSEEE
jgi:hypothetical protein